MADNDQERATSIAKSLDGLAQKDSALDRALKLKDLYNRTANPQEHQQTREADQSRNGDQQGSKMVKEDAPTLRPTPSGPMRQMTDDKIYDAKLQKERANEEAKIEAARKAQEAFKDRQQQDRDQERDRER